MASLASRCSSARAASKRTPICFGCGSSFTSDSSATLKSAASATEAPHRTSHSSLTLRVSVFAWHTNPKRQRDPSELQQRADRSGELGKLCRGVVPPESRAVGKVAANLRADLEELRRVPVQPQGHFGISCGNAGPGTALIAEPLGTANQVPLT